MKKIPHKKFSFNRLLRHEPLESREMLTVTLSGTDWNMIHTNYADLGLSANQSDYNIIVLEYGIAGNGEDRFAFDATGLQ